MPTCNIDARGKRLRLLGGLALLALAAVLAFAWALPTGSLVAWIVSVATLLSGAFMVYEARAGWCALRAMGVKTPV